MPYAEWTQLKEQAAAIPIRRTSLPQASIRRDPPSRQPKTETFTVGSASQPEFDMAISAVPTENPWSAHVVEPSQRTGMEIHRSIVPVAPAPSPPPASTEPVHINPYWESLADLQALRDMLPDDIPIEFQKNVRPAILQLSPSWRQAWAKKRERDLQKTMWDNRLKKKRLIFNIYQKSVDKMKRKKAY